MSIHIQVQHNFGIIKSYLKTMSTVSVKKAVVQACNRSAVTGRKEAAKILGKTIKLPQGGRSSKGGGGLTPPGIKSMITITKARYGRNIPVDRMFSTINSSDKPISLIHFVRGAKSPRPQLGIPIKNRLPIQVEITKGRKLRLNKAFIAKSRRGGSVQVYRKDGNAKMVKQSAPALYRWFVKPHVIGPTRDIITKRYAEEFPRQLNYYLNIQRAPKIAPK